MMRNPKTRFNRVFKFYLHVVNGEHMGTWVEGLDETGKYVEEWIINHEEPQPIKWKVYFNDEG